ncbi:unnamed protein product [Chironomus riparius]|uniref:Uncharacterized protein n=1 Tax=Chironomus riparius TaxID=315576 RepID=A0A9N9WT55_9DIPT|nr:unnamed protein product [Chironomus riparius]
MTICSSEHIHECNQLKSKNSKINQVKFEFFIRTIL